MSRYSDRFVIRGVFILVSFVCSAQATRADEGSQFKFDDTVSAAEREVADLYMSGMMSSRERLITGEYIAVGRVSRKRPEVAPLEGEFGLYSCFDYQNGMLRFDRREQVYVESFAQVAGTSASTPATKRKRMVKSELIEGRCILTPERLIDWHDAAPGQVRINERGSKNLSGSAMPFDVRALGLVLLSGLESNMSVMEMVSLCSRQEITEVVAETNDVCRITWDFGPTERIRRIVWLDQRFGFSPTRMELWSSGLRDKPSTTPVLLTKSTCTWHEQEHVWVPTSFVIEGEMDGPKPAKYELSFNWLNVNQPVAPSKFTPEGLKVRDYAMVLDVRGDAPVLVGELNGPSPSAQPVAMPNAKQFSFQFVMVNVGIAMIIVALVIAWRVKHASNRPQ